MASNSTNPFLPGVSLPSVNTTGKLTVPTTSGAPTINLNTGGSTTQATATPINPLINTHALGAQATSPTPTTPSNTLPSSYVKPATTTTSTPSIDYTLHPGESIDAYNARIAQARSTQGGTASPATPSPQGGYGTKAPDGMEYGPDGVLRPIQSTPTPSTGTSQPYSATDNGLYGKLIADLANRSSQASSDYAAAKAAYDQINQQLQESRSNEAKSLALNASNPIPLEFQQGRGQILQSQYLAQQGALASQLQGASNVLGAANTQGQIQQQGLLGAAGLASPTQVPYSNQYLNPLTGQPVGGGGSIGGSALSSLPPQAQTAIQSYAEQVRNGSMTRADAESRLSAYGVVGTNALNEVLGNNFNTNASNASASTTAQGQQLQTAAKSTYAALDSLQTAFNQLNGLQTGGIPATNGIANWIAQQFGSGALSSYNTVLHDARAQIQGVLTASGAATPTGAESMAQVLLPDNMTPAQLQQNLQIIRTLIQQKVTEFTQSGQQTINQNGTFSVSGTNPESSSNGGYSLYSF